MARTDNDTWDLASSVGATATAVAASRAMASQNPDALLNDPWADPLVRAVGIDTFVKLIDGETGHTDDPLLNRRAMNEQITVRTRFFDDFFVHAAESGIRQAVILASGLDTRAYRLPWPADTKVFEIDQPQVIAFKTRTLADLGAEPTAERTTVAIDLREDWPAALVEAGFDPKLPTAWSAEGLLVYLPPDAQDRLFDNIAAPVRTGQPHRHRTHGPAQYSSRTGQTGSPSDHVASGPTSTWPSCSTAGTAILPPTISKTTVGTSTSRQPRRSTRPTDSSYPTTSWLPSAMGLVT